MRIDTELLDLEINNEEQRELGPLKYLSETTGRDMGTVVNWFLLLIVFVFDPLAIAMVVAANFAFSQIKNPKRRELLKISRKIEKKNIPKRTKEVTKILDKAGMWNPHWKFINYKELKKYIKANILIYMYIYIYIYYVNYVNYVYYVYHIYIYIYIYIYI